jgi:quercetin dioxygenase-like cupin family protein
MTRLTRRMGLIGAAGLSATGAMRVSAALAPPRPFSTDSEANGRLVFQNIHGGNGSTSVKFFPFGDAPAPANFLTYVFAPGSSEGVHVHRLGDEKLGSFDEYYYIVSGSGLMMIDGQAVPVAAGDHVHTPLGVRHGIENTSPDQDLKVFLTFIRR